MLYSPRVMDKIKRMLTRNGLAIGVVAGLDVALLLVGAIGGTAVAETVQKFQGKIEGVC